MKILSRFLGAIAFIFGIAFIISFPIEGLFAKRAKMIQRVAVDPALAALGDEGTPIGEPALMIVDDPKAYLGKRTVDGAELVSEYYLKEHGIYPLQLKTVRYVSGQVRIVSVISAMLLGLAAVLAHKRSQKLLLDKGNQQ